MFWIREIAGWALVGCGLWLVNTGLTLVTSMDSPRIVEAGVVMFAAMAVMRSGILLIRISTAARICRAERGTGKS